VGHPVQPPAHYSKQFYRSSATFTQRGTMRCTVLPGTTSSNPVGGNPPFGVSPDRSDVARGKWNHTSTECSSANSPHCCHNPPNHFSELDLRSERIVVSVTRRTQSGSAGSRASIRTHTAATGHKTALWAGLVVFKWCSPRKRWLVWQR